MTVEISETRDLAAVRELLTDPLCYSRMGDDTAPLLAQFAVTGGPYRFIQAVEGERMAAVFMLVPKDFYMASVHTLKSGSVAEVHFCFCPFAWGRSIAIAKRFTEWVWANTLYIALDGMVPSYNRLALKLARDAGFTPMLCLRGGMRRGEPYSRILCRAWRNDAAA